MEDVAAIALCQHLDVIHLVAVDAVIAILSWQLVVVVLVMVMDVLGLQLY